MIKGSETAARYFGQPKQKEPIRLTKKGKPLKGYGYPKDEIGLNEMQRKVIELVAQGLSNEEIALEMNTNYGVVTMTKTSAARVLGANNPAHLMVICYQKGILKVETN